MKDTSVIDESNTTLNKEDQLFQRPTGQKLSRLNSFVVILIMVFIVGVTGAGYFISKSLLLQDGTQEQLTQPIELEVISTVDWQTYSKDGLAFQYAPEWSITEEPPVTSFGNQKEWRIERIDDDRDLVVVMRRIRKYDTLPRSDVLRSYLFENIYKSNHEEINQQVKYFILKGRTAIEYTTPYSRTVIISLPESDEILFIKFYDWLQPNDTPEATLAQAIKTHFEPFLESLEISKTTWPEPGTYMSIVSNATVDTENWQHFSEKNYRFSHPKTWTVRDTEVNDTPSFELLKTAAVNKSGSVLPRVILGSPDVFSTSGALCANASTGECDTVGQVEIEIQGRTHSAEILRKKDRQNNQFFYVFRLSVNQFSSTGTITALFENQRDGQEIVNILSTLLKTEE